MKKAVFIIGITIILSSKFAYSFEIDSEFFNMTLPDEMHVVGNGEGVVYAREKKETSRGSALLITYVPTNNKKYHTQGLNAEQVVKKYLKQYKSMGPEKIPRSDGLIEYRFMGESDFNNVVNYFAVITIGVEKGIISVQYSSAESMNISVNYVENLINEIKWK